MSSLNPLDLRVDTYQRGAGGMSPVAIDACVRVTHEPTGIVVECNKHRSQHKNKAEALALLELKLEGHDISELEHD